MSDPFDVSMDDEFEVDLGKEGSRPPAGTAIVELAHVKKQVSQSGNPMWVFEFKIVEYRQIDGDGNGGDWTGEVLPVFCALTPNALWKLAETLTALGVPATADAQAKFKLSEVVGTQCLASLKHSEFNGREQTNIDALRAVEGKKKAAPVGEPESEESEVTPF